MMCTPRTHATGRLEDLSPAQRGTVLQYLLDQLALYQARATATQQCSGVVLPNSN